MLNTKAIYPWWVTEPDDIAAILASCKRGTVHTLCQSAGGYEIPYITYGEYRVLIFSISRLSPILDDYLLMTSFSLAIISSTSTP